MAVAGCNCNYFQFGALFALGGLYDLSLGNKHTIIDDKRLAFDGTALQLFGNWIKWWLACFITFGIYGFWVGIKVKQWKVKHTYFADGNVEIFVEKTNPMKQPETEQERPSAYQEWLQRNPGKTINDYYRTIR